MYTLLQEHIQIANGHAHSWPTLLIIREIQIKSTIANHLTLVRRAIIENSKIKNREKGILLHCWWECELVQLLWKTVWRLLRKLKIELPYDLEIPLLGVCPETTLVQINTCTPQRRAVPARCHQRESMCSNKDAGQPITVSKF